MSYRFETENKNYEDYASGRVLYNQHGTTAFPVRLAGEIFLRCADLLTRAGRNGPYAVYDPCCGGAYMLTAIGFMHGERISRIVASDIDGKAVELAGRNLALLSPEGMDTRIRQITQMVEDYHKQSHREALQSALRLKERTARIHLQSRPISFTADITHEAVLSEYIQEGMDMVISDLPYGEIVQWSEQQDQDNAVERMLAHLAPVLNAQGVIALVSRERLRLENPFFRRVEQFKLGKRHIYFYQKRV